MKIKLIKKGESIIKIASASNEKFGHWAYYEKDCKNWEAK